MSQKDNEITRKIQAGIDPEDIDDELHEELEIAEEFIKKHKNILRKLAKDDKNE